MKEHFNQQRLQAVEQFFDSENDVDLLGCYVWTQAVAAGLLPILGDFEVTLRNALHRSLSMHYSLGQSDSFDWMMRRPNPIKNHPHPFVRAHHNMTPGSQQNILDIVNKKTTPTPDDVVAALSFGFWERIIAGLDYSAHGKKHPNLQADILSRAIPHAPQSPGFTFGDLNFKNQIVALLNRVRDIRNRVGHHDAIWKTPEFDDFGVIGFIPREPRHTIISINKAIEKIAEMAGWIDPSIPVYMRKTRHWAALKSLLTRQALAMYRLHGGGKYLHLEGPGKMRRSKPENVEKIMSRIKLRKLHSYHF